MAGTFDNFRSMLDRLTTRQMFQIGLALLATVGVIWGVSQYATRVRYGVLLTGIDPDDASMVVAELKERKVPYRLTGAGRVIEVPAGQVDELRMDLAGQGLPAQEIADRVLSQAEPYQAMWRPLVDLVGADGSVHEAPQGGVWENWTQIALPALRG